MLIAEFWPFGVLKWVRDDVSSGPASKPLPLKSAAKTK